jgi:hypothetical protein
MGCQRKCDDIGYIFSRVQWLRREEKAAEAAELILSAPNDLTQAVDGDKWWIERRFISRTLLDLGDAKTAYRVASAAPVPSWENYRAEQQFMSGWIALRFLDDANTALAHFAIRFRRAGVTTAGSVGNVLRIFEWNDGEKFAGNSRHLRSSWRHLLTEKIRGEPDEHDTFDDLFVADVRCSELPSTPHKRIRAPRLRSASRQILRRTTAPAEAAAPLPTCVAQRLVRRLRRPRLGSIGK